MNHPHHQKSVMGPDVSTFRNASGNQRHKEWDGTMSIQGGSSSKAYHQPSASRLRQRRVCLPGCWVSHP